jgi:thiol-disulfide isomerase/thioredoxin
LTAILAFAFVNELAAQDTTATAGKDRPVDPPAAASSIPKVTKIDIEGLKPLLKPDGRPLLINFWATWCPPCREEFPDLVKLDKEFGGKIDVITISMDDPGDIDTLVPQFLAKMNAGMPTYLLHTPDEDAAIKLVTPDYSGNLPLTVLYESNGKTAYVRKGKIKYETVAAEINKLFDAPLAGRIYSTVDLVKIKDGKRAEAMYYYENNWRLYREEALRRGLIHSYELIDTKSEANSSIDLILITRYLGPVQFRESEKNFEPILKQMRPNGPILKNEIKPADFRQSVFLYNGESPFFSTK